MRRPAPARELPPPLELLCLKALWPLGEGSVGDVRRSLTGHRALAYTTVMTVLERLARRGLVVRRKVGRSFHYAPRMSRDAVRGLALREFLEQHFDGSREALLAFLGNGAAQAAPSGALPPPPAAHLDTALL
ncbi:MAG: BlaI/MecI/CopY family transcriptional regulator [Acidobacteria bacterium]|nr:BlaI/MecI/CopY family transcriptional regulator [Acidobacteriota bacterium]